MRCFGLIFLALAVAALFLIPSKRERAATEIASASDTVASTTPPSNKSASGSDERPMIEADAKIAEADAATPAANKASPDRSVSASDNLTEGQADSESFTSSHIPSSAKAGKIDPGREMASGADLVAATQRELARARMLCRGGQWPLGTNEPGRA